MVGVPRSYLVKKSPRTGKFAKRSAISHRIAIIVGARVSHHDSTASSLSLSIGKCFPIERERNSLSLGNEREGPVAGTEDLGPRKGSFFSGDLEGTWVECRICLSTLTWMAQSCLHPLQEILHWKEARTDEEWKGKGRSIARERERERRNCLRR